MARGDTIRLGLPVSASISNSVERLRSWTRYAGAFGLILLGLFAADLMSLRLRPHAMYQLDVGFWGDQELLDGVWDQETDPRGATYRWTSARSVFAVRDFAVVAHPMLQISIGGLPPGAPSIRPVQLQLDNGAITLPVTAAPRRYHLTLPAGALLDGNLDAVFTSATSRAASDPREVGVRLDSIALGWSIREWALPVWWTLAIQGLAVVVWAGIARQLRLPRWSKFVVTMGSIVLLAWMTSYELLMATAWQARLLAGSLIVLGLVSIAFPLLRRLSPEIHSPRELRWLCAFTAVAIGIRLFAIFYPPFGSHDLYIHQQRLRDVQFGSLQLFDTPSEFARQRTIVPSAFYLLASPFMLLTVNPGVAIQGLYALLDGTSALLLALFVRRIGGSARAARLAAIAIASLPIQLTALWWGFAPQIVGQWLLLVLALFVAYRGATGRGFWIAAGVVLVLALLMHNGVAILGGGWLLTYLLLVWVREPQERHRVRVWAVVLAVCCFLAVLLLYVDVITLQLLGLAGGATTPRRITEVLRITLLGQALLASLRPLGPALTVASLIVLVLRAHGTQRLLVVGWLASAGFFLLVDLVLNLQVRYAYFAMPMICAGLGLLLDRLMARRWGKLIGWSLLGIVVWSGLGLWFEGIFAFVKPTLMALTH